MPGVFPGRIARRLVICWRPRGSGWSSTSATGALGVLQRHAELFRRRRGLHEPPARRSLRGPGRPTGWRGSTAADGPRPSIPVYGPHGTAERVAGFGGEDKAAGPGADSASGSSRQAPSRSGRSWSPSMGSSRSGRCRAGAGATSPTSTAAAGTATTAAAPCQRSPTGWLTSRQSCPGGDPGGRGRPRHLLTAARSATATYCPRQQARRRQA